MFKCQKELISILRYLSLDSNEIKVYLTLIEYGELTILLLSKITGIPRTNIYRTIFKFKKLFLVNVQKGRVRVTGTNKISLLIERKEEEIIKLKKLFPVVEKFLTEIS